MVRSRIGRPHLAAEIGQGRLQPRPLTKANHRDVWEPRPPLALVDAEPLQALMEIVRQGARTTARVAQGEHADAPGLAIALRHEPDWPRTCGGIPQRLEDGLQLGHRTVTEEGEREVQVVARNDSAVAEVLLLPAGQRLEHRLGETEGTEQARALTTLQASGEFHTSSLRLCCKSRRTRWSAV